MVKNSLLAVSAAAALLTAVWSLTVLRGGEIKEKQSKLQWLPLEQGLAKAAKEKKFVLVDFYTDWCSWCKVMDKETYGNEKVQKLLSERFVAVKVNAESDERVPFKGKKLTGRQLAAAHGVNGYPTTTFLESDGDWVTSVPGYLPPEPFLKVLKYIGGRYYEKMDWQQFEKTPTE